MPINPQSKMIGEAEYTVSPFSGGESLKVFLLLVKLIGPPIGECFNGDLGAGLAKACANLDEHNTTSLIQRMLKGTYRVIDGEQVEISKIFDREFQANLSGLFDLLGFVVQVNYPDFFAGGSSFENLMGFILKVKLFQDAMSGKSAPAAIAAAGSEKGSTPNSPSSPPTGD